MFQRDTSRIIIRLIAKRAAVVAAVAFILFKEHIFIQISLSLSLFLSHSQLEARRKKEEPLW